MESRTPNRIPVGLRKPWQWFQPETTSELITRLIEASDFLVHERERENLCSVAAAKIRTLDKDLTAANERLREAEKDARKMYSLLQEWMNTELDSMDEEHDQWLELFSARVNDCLIANAALAVVK